MRQAREIAARLLSGPQWREHKGEIVSMGLVGVNALFSLLPTGGETTYRAAACMGAAVAALAEHEPEEARNVIRRLMWHMNEDSGNIGWGIPEAFGEILAASETLARQYSAILISYIIELPGADNYCDHHILRRSCYWAIGRLAESRPELAAKARSRLVGGLEDEDVVCRGMAAWALSRFALNLTDLTDMADAPALRRLAEAGHSETCLLFDGENVFEKSVSALAQEALERVRYARAR